MGVNSIKSINMQSRSGSGQFNQKCMMVMVRFLSVVGCTVSPAQASTMTCKVISVRFCVTTNCIFSMSLQNSPNKLLGDSKSSFVSLQIHKHYSLFSSLPQIACLAFLSFQYPLLLFKGFKGTEKTNATEVRAAGRVH